MKRDNKSEVVEIDSNANRVLAHWALSPGEGPTGLAIDVEHHRLFAGCDGNAKLVILDSDSGKILGTADVGKGVDGDAFDSTLGALVANGDDGTISVVQETSPGKFETVKTVPTLKSARTIAIDEKTHHALLPCNAADGKTFVIAVVGSEQ